jgi:hypothetical protein
VSRNDQTGIRQGLLSNEPVIQSLTGGDLTHIPGYRWRYIRDYSLRQDDGRYGLPCMVLGMDEEPEEVGNLRNDVLRIIWST